MNATVALFVAALIWQVVVWATDVPHFILPSPIRVAEALWSNLELIIEHAGITIAEVIIGLVIGSLLGAVTAIQLMMSPLARRFVLPVLVFSQAVLVFLDGKT